MKTFTRLIIPLLILPVLLIGLPLLGVMLDGKPVVRYMEFPPLTHYVEHAGFNWYAFIGLAVAILAVVLPLDLRIMLTMSKRRIRNGEPLSPAAGRFPWWGWLALASLAASWIMAWTRFEWFTGFQHFTFSPLWFSYILLINALTRWRSGYSMLTCRPVYFLTLFPVSAGFWWFFEYLNRFVQNWYYQGILGLSPFEYFIFATLPFSTVLPAVLGTFDFLKTFTWAGMGLETFVPVRLPVPKVAAGLALVICSAGLAAIGIFPDHLFPLLWLSPLFIVTSIMTLQDRQTVLSGLRAGNWRDVYLLAMAALICGFLWEMWNYHSLARWVYAVPFVGNFKVFEMPLLGYAGYLPFGLECAVVGGMTADFVEWITGKGGKHED